MVLSSVTVRSEAAVILEASRLRAPGSPSVQREVTAGPFQSPRVSVEARHIGKVSLGIGTGSPSRPLAEQSGDGRAGRKGMWKPSS